jgi:hypothetical protein
MATDQGRDVIASIAKLERNLVAWRTRGRSTIIDRESRDMANSNVIWSAEDGWHDGPRATTSVDHGRLTITHETCEDRDYRCCELDTTPVELRDEDGWYDRHVIAHRRRLCEHRVTLDGADATVNGIFAQSFAVVRRLDGQGGPVEYAWPTVSRVIDQGGHFKS